MGKILVFFSMFMLVSCTNVYKQVSPSIKLKTEEALNKVSLDRKKVLIEAITELPVDQQEGMAYFSLYASERFRYFACRTAYLQC